MAILHGLETPAPRPGNVPFRVVAQRDGTHDNDPERKADWERHTVTRRFIVHENCLGLYQRIFNKKATIIVSSPIRSPFPGYLLTVKWHNTTTTVDDTEPMDLCGRDCEHTPCS